jgi:hypothetical protein
VVRYFPDGSPREQGEVDGDGARDGVWTRFAPDGSTREVTTWDHGQRR